MKTCIDHAPPCVPPINWINVGTDLTFRLAENSNIVGGLGFLDFFLGNGAFLGGMVSTLLEKFKNTK